MRGHAPPDVTACEAAKISPTPRGVALRFHDLCTTAHTWLTERSRGPLVNPELLRAALFPDAIAAPALATELRAPTARKLACDDSEDKLFRRSDGISILPLRRRRFGSSKYYMVHVAALCLTKLFAEADHDCIDSDR
jgi:hypothetical protein